MDGIAFDPCHKCDKSISCGMCELYMRRNGLLQRTSDEQIFDGEMTKYYSKRAVLDTRYEGNNGFYDVYDLEEYLECVPTADVVPREAVEALMKENERWMTGFREGVKSVVENVKQELVMEIFEEINSLVGEYEMGDIEYPDFRFRLGKLEKKHTEETDGKQA